MILSLLEALFGIATVGACITASVLTLKRNANAPTFLVIGGGCGLAFGWVANQFEVSAVAVLLLAAGIVLMMPSEVTYREIGESTATRRRR